MKIRVIIAEDDHRIALLHQSMVEKLEGYEVVSVANTIGELKEHLEYLEPDLVLLDLYFPDGNGIDFLSWLRQHELESDVILITAAKEMQALEKSLRFGVFDYLIKPIMFGRFEAALEKFKNYKIHFQDKTELSQSTVDSFLHGGTTEEKTASQDLPKGVDSITLEKILNLLKEETREFSSATNIAKKLGINRTTARRYLEFLVSIQRVEVDSLYGSVGRPERKYKLKTV